jgi:NADH-quinone oxidoreductase subunit E
MATEAVLSPEVDLAPAEQMIAGYLEEPEAVIALLQDVQTHYGYLPRQVLDLISDRLKLPRTQLHGLATFYRAFTLVPQGKHKICVCTGTACHVRGAPAVLDRLQSDLKVKPGGTTDDRLFSLYTVNCLGACALGPLVTVDGNYEGHVTVSKTRKLLRRYGFKKEGQDDASESE